MNEASQLAVFAEVHKAITESAKAAVSLLGGTARPGISYPPGVAVSAAEAAQLAALDLSPEARTALEKVIADACSHPVLQLLSLLDGTTEPEVIKLRRWEGGSLGEIEGDTMLHDEFLEAYGDYQEHAEDEEG